VDGLALDIAKGVEALLKGFESALRGPSVGVEYGVSTPISGMRRHCGTSATNGAIRMPSTRAGRSAVAFIESPR